MVLIQTKKKILVHPKNNNWKCIKISSCQISIAIAGFQWISFSSIRIPEKFRRLIFINLTKRYGTESTKDKLLFPPLFFCQIMHSVCLMNCLICRVFQVSVIQLEETTVLYQKQISSQLNSGITSLHFGSSAQNGIVKKILLVGTEDSSILPLEKDSGNLLIAKPLQPKKPSKALLLRVLGMYSKK